MTWLYWVLVVALWVGTGVLGVLLLLHRRGYRDGAWYILGAVLGPLFAPIAAERARPGSAVLHRHVEPAAAAGGRAAGGGLRVLVGVDGSPGSERAVLDAARLVAPAAGRIILVTVVDAGCADHGDAEQTAWARRLLRRCADQARAAGATVETEIVSGEPVQALRDLADAEDVDLVVVGRCGRGVSRRLVGSVADQLSASARQPVLLAAPPGARGPGDRPVTGHDAAPVTPAGAAPLRSSLPSSGLPWPRR